MNLNIFKKKEERSFPSIVDINVNPMLGTLQFSSFSNYTQSKSLQLSVVYRCVNLISDAVASLPLLPYTYGTGNWKTIDYSNNLYNLLNVQPNGFISAYTFKKLIVQHTLLFGNAYIAINRNNNGIVEELSLLYPDNVEIVVENGDIRYNNTFNGQSYDKSQIIHIQNYTVDGIKGVSTLYHAARSLGIAYDSDEHASNFVKGGTNLGGILRPVAGTSINKDKAAKAKSDFLTTLNPDLGGISGGLVVLGDGLEYQAIAVNPKDAQLLESRQFSVIDICRFFNVPPSLAFSETGKFSTAEQQQVDFLNNTLTPWLEKIESEFYRKLYTKLEYATTELKFNPDNLLRTDYNSKADYYVKMHNIGAFTTNEIRAKENAEFPVTGGDRAFVQVNLQPLDNLVQDISKQQQQIDKNNNNG